jgi:hypothetical protein
MKQLFTLIIFYCSVTQFYSQCSNGGTQNLPTTTNINYTTITPTGSAILPLNWCRVSGFEAGAVYKIRCQREGTYGDNPYFHGYVTIRNNTTNAVITHGQCPFDYTVPTPAPSGGLATLHWTNGVSCGSSAWLHYGSVQRITPLPLNFLSIDGRNNKDGNIILWTTTNEVNCDYQVIERSTDSHVWEEIGKISSNNIKDQINDYEYVDQNFNLSALYRVHNVDFDGRESYSEIVKVLANNDANVFEPYYRIDDQTMWFNDDIWSMDIYSIGGILLQSSKNLQGMVSLEQLPSGVFIAKMRSELGKEYVRKIVKM